MVILRLSFLGPKPLNIIFECILLPLVRKLQVDLRLIASPEEGNIFFLKILQKCTVSYQVWPWQMPQTGQRILVSFLNVFKIYTVEDERKL